MIFVLKIIKLSAFTHYIPNPSLANLNLMKAAAHRFSVNHIQKFEISKVNRYFCSINVAILAILNLNLCVVWQ